MNKAIFLDRDGTIIKDKNYAYKKEDIKFLPKSIEGLKLLQDNNYNLIIVTNQSGIARGFFSETDYFNFRDELHHKLELKGVNIDAEYFCPHHFEEGRGKYRINCTCRKPNPGMILEAKKDFNLNLDYCWMIGDRESDIIAGWRANCKSIFISSKLEEKIFHNPIFPNFFAKDLLEAAIYITQNKNK
jgi:D,D-heptose 1,7-bisphosphate phosphatase